MEVKSIVGKFENNILTKNKLLSERKAKKIVSEALKMLGYKPMADQSILNDFGGIEHDGTKITAMQGCTEGLPDKIAVGFCRGISSIYVILYTFVYRGWAFRGRFSIYSGDVDTHEDNEWANMYYLIKALDNSKRVPDGQFEDVIRNVLDKLDGKYDEYNYKYMFRNYTAGENSVLFINTGYDSFMCGHTIRMMDAFSEDPSDLDLHYARFARNTREVMMSETGLDVLDAFLDYYIKMNKLNKALA